MEDSGDVAVPIFFFCMLVILGVTANIIAYFDKEWRFDITSLCKQGRLYEREVKHHMHGEQYKLIDAPELMQWLNENNLSYHFLFGGYDSYYGGYDKTYIVFKKEKHAMFFKLYWRLEVDRFIS